MHEYDTTTDTPLSYRHPDRRPDTDAETDLATIVAPSRLNRYQRKHYLGVST